MQLYVDGNTVTPVKIFEHLDNLTRKEQLLRQLFTSNKKIRNKRKLERKNKQKARR